MAIYHFQAQVIKRSVGKSSVAAAAYRAGEKIVDEKTGLTHNYANKSGVAHSEIYLPNNAPKEYKDRKTLWNAVEDKEKRKDSQLAKEVMVALPKELTLEQNVKLIEEFVKDAFVSKGMIADANIHIDNPENPHCHILLTTRHVNESGFGLKAREWNSPINLCYQRKLWEELGNNQLAKEGHAPTLCQASLKDRGIEREPQIHLGRNALGMAEKGDIGSIGKVLEYFDISRENGEKIIKDPDIAIKEIGQNNSTFTEYAIADYAFKNSANTSQYQDVLFAITTSKEIVRLGKNDMADFVYASKDAIRLETKMVQGALRLNATDNHNVSDAKVDKAITEFESDNFNLASSQKEAIYHIARSGDFSMVRGYAGTGKSTIMGVVKNFYEDSRYQVQGCAIAGKAAEGLMEGSGINSKTIDSLLKSIEINKSGINSRTVLVVDEAGMADTGRLNKLIQHCKAAGAKIVLLGDENQLQAIGAGGAFKGLANKFGSSTLNSIIRQKVPGNDEKTYVMRQATEDFASGNIGKALKAYDNMGAITFHESREAAIKAMASMHMLNQAKNLGEAQLCLAYTNKETNEINHKIREERISKNEITKGANFRTKTGQNNFSVGDRIYFKENSKDIGVKNGTLGTISRIKGNKFVVDLDGKEAIQASFDIRKYSNIDHGYATTISKSQGVSVQGSQCLASKSMDANLTYVACTRHKENLHIHVSKDVCKDINELTKVYSRVGFKDMAIDFAKSRDVNVEDKLKERIDTKDLRDLTMKIEALSKSSNISTRQPSNNLPINQPNQRELTQRQAMKNNIHRGKSGCVLETKIDALLKSSNVASKSISNTVTINQDNQRELIQKQIIDNNADREKSGFTLEM